MKSKILLLAGFLLSVTAFSQVPEDVLKYSWGSPFGTARNQAIGGAMGSLGGDITATFTNPAGLGFYKTNELVITPAFSFLKNKSNYRSSLSTDNSNSFNLGTSGAVWGFSDRYSKWKNTSISIAVTRSANFNNSLYYKGQNDFSSFSEQYAAEIASSQLSLDNVLNSNIVSFGSRMAVYAFLADTLTLRPGNPPQVVGQPMRKALMTNSGFLLDQEKQIVTKGGITEIALGFAANMDDKIYIGGSIGLPIVNYEKSTSYTERDATGDTTNYFGYASLNEKYATKGIGINLKGGIIFKPANQIRIGLAIHSPTFYGLKDTYDATLIVDAEGYVPYPKDRPNFRPHTTTVSVGTFNSGAPAEYKYDLISPWHFLVSGSYVFQEVEDVKKQRGFLTADIEYVTYKNNSFSTADNNTSTSYYDGVNAAIKQYYKSAFNFRVGGELKFNTIMARLGFSYYGNPYKDSELKGRKMFVSGGLGYRNKGIFVDLTYVLGLYRDVNFPYRLSDKANTFAAVNSTGSNIALTFGYKF